MRQRNIKNLDERIEANANYLIEDPRACRGHWQGRSAFHSDYRNSEIHLLSGDLSGNRMRQGKVHYRACRA